MRRVIISFVSNLQVREIENPPSKKVDQILLELKPVTKLGSATREAEWWPGAGGDKGGERGVSVLRGIEFQLGEMKRV